jgi:hypothetical protein
MRQLPDLDMWVRLCGACEIFIHSEPLLQFRLRSGNANASADISPHRERASYESAKILERYSRLPLSDQLPDIFPGSFTDCKTELQQLLALAELAMKVQSSAHLLFALDCLRRLAETSGVSPDQEGARLLELGLRATPFSPASNYIRIFHRATDRPFTPEHSQLFALGMNRLQAEQISIRIPSDCIQLRIHPTEQIAIVRIFHLTITDRNDVEVWNFDGSPEGIEISNAKRLSTSERPFRLLALSNDPQIILPEIHALEGWHLNLSLSAESDIGADLQKLSLEGDETKQKNEALQNRILELKEVIESARSWQQKPWFKRAFRRWKSPIK